MRKALDLIADVAAYILWVALLGMMIAALVVGSMGLWSVGLGYVVIILGGIGSLWILWLYLSFVTDQTLGEEE